MTTTTTTSRTLARVTYADGAVFEIDATPLVAQYARLETLRVLAEMQTSPADDPDLTRYSVDDAVRTLTAPDSDEARAFQTDFIDWLASQHAFYALEPLLHTSRRPGEASVNYAAAWPTADISLHTEGETE